MMACISWIGKHKQMPRQHACVAHIIDDMTILLEVDRIYD
jgi:hypothetical protein